MTNNRYPGPKAFTDADQPSFYGRGGDIENLFRMILLKKVTVLFGKSGTGKSSLLNAGILPKFKERGDYDAMSVRFLLYSPELTATCDEPYLRRNIKDHFNLPADVPTLLDKIPGRHDSLLLHFKKLQLLNKNKSYILILDQFEEIGSYPLEDVKTFLCELNELLHFQVPPDFEKALNEALNRNENLLSEEEFSLLYEPVPVKVVFTVKSEKIGILHSVKDYISDILQNCYELQPLNRSQAGEAITEPAGKDNPSYYKVLPFFYEGRAVDAIINFLEESSGGNYFYENRGIETAMLQIICMHIEQEFATKDMGTPRLLTLEMMGSPEALARNYYEKQINKLAEEYKLDTKTKRKVSEFVEEKLVQVRGESKYREQVFLENLPERFAVIREKGLADKLVDTGLLRKERRADGRVFYELSHEKLIEPVLAANQQRKTKQLSPESVTVSATISSNGELSGINAQASGFSEGAEKSDITLSDPVICIRKGDELVSRKDFEGAIERYTQATRLNADYYYAYYQRGTAYFLNGDMEKAISDFKTVLDLEPAYYIAYNEMGRCYLHLADKAWDENRQPEAKEAYQRALAAFTETVKADDQAHYAFNNIGLVHLRLLETEEAVSWFGRALQVHPSYLLSYLNRALAYSIQEKYAEAIQDFNVAIELNPDEGYAYFGKGVCCYHWAQKLPAGKEEEKNRLYGEAIQALTEAMRLDNNYGLALGMRGLCYEQLNEFKEALNDYTRLIELNPSDKNAWYRRGLCYSQLENYATALADLSQALQLNPDDIEARFERALVHFRLQQYKEALADFAEVVKRNRDYYQAWYNQGLCHNYLTNYQAAIVSFDEAISLYAAYHQAWYNRGLCQDKLAQHEAAVADFGEAIRLFPDYTDAYFARASTFYTLSKYKEAADDFTEAIERKKDYYQAWFNRGLCHSVLGDTDAALADFTEAIRLNPGHINALFERGLIYFDRKDFKKALADYEEIINHNPELENAWYNAGLCLKQLEDTAAAIHAFQQTLNINEDNHEAAYQLGICYCEQKKYADALECFSAVAFKRPDYPDINLSFGVVYYYTGDFEKAIEFFTKQLSIGENDATTYSNRADAYRHSGNYAAAEKDLNRAMELNAEDPFVYANRALLALEALKDEAAFFSLMQTAVEKGYPLYKHVDEEAVLLSYKEDSRFQELVEQSKAPMPAQQA